MTAPPNRESPLIDVAPVSAAIMRLAHEQRAVAANRLAALGLFPGQELVLAQLWASDGRSQKELVDSLQLDHSTVAKSVQRLERAGLVDRTRSATDGRVMLVSLTAAGRTLEEPVRDIWADLEARWAARLSPPELARFSELAARLGRTQPVVGPSDRQPD
jgi:DNA-binding MarR family transcriptional regulator